MYSTEPPMAVQAKPVTVPEGKLPSYSRSDVKTCPGMWWGWWGWGKMGWIWFNGWRILVSNESLMPLGWWFLMYKSWSWGARSPFVPSAASSRPSHWFSDVFRQSRFIDSQLHRRRLSSVLFRCVALCCASVAVWGALRTSWSPKSNLRVLTLQHISSEETILCGAILQHLNIAKQPTASNLSARNIYFEPVILHDSAILSH